jgi:hypothetical protein
MTHVSGNVSSNPSDRFVYVRPVTEPLSTEAAAGCFAAAGFVDAGFVAVFVFATDVCPDPILHATIPTAINQKKLHHK